MVGRKVCRGIREWHVRLLGYLVLLIDGKWFCSYTALLLLSTTTQRPDPTRGDIPPTAAQLLHRVLHHNEVAIPKRGNEFHNLCTLLPGVSLGMFKVLIVLLYPLLFFRCDENDLIPPLFGHSSFVLTMVATRHPEMCAAFSLKQIKSRY